MLVEMNLDKMKTYNAFGKGLSDYLEFTCGFSKLGYYVNENGMYIGLFTYNHWLFDAAAEYRKNLQSSTLNSNVNTQCYTSVTEQNIAG